MGSDVELHSIGGKYILAPGLNVFAEYVHANVVVNGTNVNNGDVGILGVGLRF